MLASKSEQAQRRERRYDLHMRTKCGNFTIRKKNSGTAESAIPKFMADLYEQGEGVTVTIVDYKTTSEIRDFILTMIDHGDFDSGRVMIIMPANEVRFNGARKET